MFLRNLNLAICLSQLIFLARAVWINNFLRDREVSFWVHSLFMLNVNQRFWVFATLIPIGVLKVVCLGSWLLQSRLIGHDSWIFSVSGACACEGILDIHNLVQHVIVYFSFVFNSLRTLNEAFTKVVDGLTKTVAWTLRSYS